VSRHESRHQREEGVEVGGEVDVRVGDDRRVAGHPGGAQRPAPALAVEVDGAYAVELGGQPGGDPPRLVGAGVVDDRHDRGEREPLVQEKVEPPDRRVEVVLVVVDGEDDLHGDGAHLGAEHEAGGRGGGHGGIVCLGAGRWLGRPLEFPPNVRVAGAGP